MSALEVGDNIKISDIKLPSDAEPTITDRDFTIVTIAGRVAVADVDEGETTDEAEGAEEAGEKEEGGED